jgi:hypothetical protein
MTPYLFAEGAHRLVEFISKAFDGEIIYRKERADGSVMHATMRIGDSMLMLAEATGEFGPMPTSVYLYVPDCECLSGERYGGVKDPCGKDRDSPGLQRLLLLTSKTFHPRNKRNGGKNSTDKQAQLGLGGALDQIML